MSTELEYINGLDFGYGFNTATYAIHPVPALDNVTEINEVPFSEGQEVLFRLQLAKSTESLSEQLDVSGKASMSYAITNNGSLKTSFTKLFKENSFTLYVTVHVLVTNKQLLLSEIKMTPEAEEIYIKNPDEFIDYYGDSFVSGLITGGEFFGVLEIKTHSEIEFSKLKAELSAKGGWGVYDASGKVTFSKALEEIKTSYEMTATVYRHGGIGELKKMTPEDLIQSALDFPASVSGERGFPRSVILVPYQDIPHSVPVPHLDVSLQASSLEDLGVYLQKLNKTKNDLQFALDYLDQFPDIDKPKVYNQINAINQEINKIKDAALSCSNNRQCDIPQIDFSLLENILPPRWKELDPLLGKYWNEEEAGWQGKWTRRGVSNVFDAEWIKEGEPTIARAVLTITRVGNTDNLAGSSFHIERRENDTDPTIECTYTGTISEDGKTIDGNYTCHWSNGPVTNPWRATIQD